MADHPEDHTGSGDSIRVFIKKQNKRIKKPPLQTTNTRTLPLIVEHSPKKPRSKK